MSVKKWEIQSGKLYKKNSFEQYKDALDFVMKVGRIAELKNHHPRMVIDYLTVEIFLYTHDKKAITDKDHDMAEMIDHLIEEI